MPNSLNAQGLTTATQAELLATLTAAYQANYGADINLESDTPDGQQMNDFIQAAVDALDLMAQIYNMFDPDNAIGVVLDQRVAINGIKRQGGTYSQVNILVTASTSVNLYGLDMPAQQIFTVSDNQGNQWQLITSQLGSTGGTYAFQAANPGAITAAANSLTTQVSVIIGVTSVNNPAANYNTGVDSETDAALKVRRQISTSLPSQGYFQSLTAALENINGITSAVVHENDSGSTDANGIPSHSIWVIVSGTPSIALATAYNSGTTYAYNQIASFSGVNYISVANNNLANTPPSAGFWNVYNPIAQAIYIYRNAGCGMKGSTSYSIGQIDGSSFPVFWDVVSEIQPFIKIQTGSINGTNPPNVASIVSYITNNYLPAVDEELNINQVSSLAQIADPNTLSIFPSTYGLSLNSGGAYTYTLTPAALNDQFQITPGHVIVLPIVMTYANQPVNTFTLGANNVLTGITAQVTHGGGSNQLMFTALGGLSILTYSKTGSGTIGSTTVVPVVINGVSINTYVVTYTSGSVGTDTVVATDTLGNTMTATISVV